ncbi:acetamidase [Bacillus sp. JCM 19046]|nr:acetamidase [Bacillus sp. JCM 19045]GAF16256.1 acetamidase [Bacillus sp. JCM 19046]
MFVSKDMHLYQFSQQAAATVKVESGRTVKVETLDAFSNQLKDEHSTFNEINMARVNPATGPIYIESAEPGDTLKVDIHKIELEEEGVMAVAPGLGVLGQQVETFSYKRMKVDEHGVHFSKNIILPLRKMIGVIGVAPSGEPIPCGTPGDHGGNMDNTHMTEGATAYFPVAVKGALFALGDVHATMGDGEVCVTGVEIDATVSVTLTVLKKKLTMPWLENEQEIEVISSALTIEEATERAVKEWANILTERTPLTFNEATMLLSASGDLSICQVVNPLKTVRLAMSKALLKQTGLIKFPG